MPEEPVVVEEVIETAETIEYPELPGGINPVEYGYIKVDEAEKIASEQISARESELAELRRKLEERNTQSQDFAALRAEVAAMKVQQQQQPTLPTEPSLYSPATEQLWAQYQQTQDGASFKAWNDSKDRDVIARVTRQPQSQANPLDYERIKYELDPANADLPPTLIEQEIARQGLGYGEGAAVVRIRRAGGWNNLVNEIKQQALAELRSGKPPVPVRGNQGTDVPSPPQWTPDGKTAQEVVDYFKQYRI